MKKFLISIFYVLLVLFLVGLYVIPPALGVSATRFIFAITGYYLILALVLLWVITLAQCLMRYKPNVAGFIRTYRNGFILCLVLVCIVFISIRPMFRVLSDETNILALSKAMLYEKKADNVIMGRWYYDNFYPTRRIVEQRPLLFPFFAYIIHTLTGYRPENVFLLNGIVLFMLLFLIYKIFKDRLGDMWASCAAILVVSQPIVSQGATCGGFELLFALFIVISFISLRQFMANPDALKFQLLWANLLLLSNIRYEGVMFFVLVILALAGFKYLKDRQFLRLNMQILYAFTILALLLVWWQRVAMKDIVTLAATNAFSFNYLPQNMIGFFSTFLNRHFSMPHAGIIDLFGFLAIFYFAVLYMTGRLTENKVTKNFLAMSAACIFIYWIFFMLFSEGKAAHPSSGRYFTIFAIVLSVLAAAFASRIKIFKQKPVYALIFAAAMFLLYHPISVEDRYSRMQVAPREFRIVSDFLKAQSKNTRNILVISDRPNQYTVFNYGAVDFNYANNDKALPREYNNHLFSDVFVVQKIEFATQQPTTQTRLNDRFELEKMLELETDGKGFVRISKVKSVKI